MEYSASSSTDIRDNEILAGLTEVTSVLS